MKKYMNRDILIGGSSSIYERDRKLIELALKKSAEWHRGVNQKYDGKDYFDTHIMSVYNLALKYMYIIPVYARTNVKCGVLLHDIIEDAQKTYSNVETIFNIEIAELVYACTNDKGRNRKERAGYNYYLGIRETKFASFIKLIDRLGNFTYSKNSGSSMFKKYKSEHIDFIKSIKGTHTLFGKFKYWLRYNLGLLDADYSILYKKLEELYNSSPVDVKINYNAD